ncbi:MAG: hypothetical protein FWF96_06865, partial [Kiritimatiellaeota bacterium]|nr:hypothetical protein [Kiritimatiellota bacterium]
MTRTLHRKSIATALALLAAMAWAERPPVPRWANPLDPLDMAQAHEKTVASGKGAIFPLEMEFVRENKGA